MPEDIIGKTLDLQDVEYPLPDEDDDRSDDHEEAQVSMSFAIAKVKDEPDFTIVKGPVLVPEKTDAQNEIVSAEEIETAAHDFLEDGGRPGLVHRVLLSSRDAVVVESGLLDRRTKIGDTTLPEGTWMLAFRVYSKQLRKLIKEGKLRGFSIGGRAKYEQEE